MLGRLRLYRIGESRLLRSGVDACGDLVLSDLWQKRESYALAPSGEPVVPGTHLPLRSYALAPSGDTGNTPTVPFEAMAGSFWLTSGSLTHLQFHRPADP
ncbi:hypothetical protein M8J75_007204 [Diaphorina citri]|nr:hypothetical protein M8J75_007204 [Diaphorina citri]